MNGLGLGVRGCLPFGLLHPSHVGNAGVGVVIVRGARLAHPTFATAQFKRFFDCGRAVRCMLPLGLGRFMHLFVLYGFQGADTDAEQLALTEQLFDAALVELSVVARGQPCLLVWDFNVELTKIPCLTIRISAGLWVDLEGAWSLAAGSRQAPTCKRTWSAAGGHRRDFMVGCPLAVAAVLSCKVQADRWVAPHLAVRALFDCCRWSGRVTQPVQRTPLWPASWLPAVDKSKGSKSVEVQMVWEVYDERLQIMSRQDALQLGDSLDAVMFLVHGLSGLGLLRLHLLVLIGLVVVPFLVAVWFLAGRVLLFVLVGLLVTRFGRLVMLLMPMMLLMFSCTVTPLFLPYLI